MKKRVCAFIGCPTPNVLLIVDGPRNGAVKYHKACAKRGEVKRQAAYRARKSGRYHYDATDVDESESAEEIEANFEAALREIKGRKRPDPLVGWQSPLARIV